MFCIHPFCIWHGRGIDALPCPAAHLTGTCGSCFTAVGRTLRLPLMRQTRQLSLAMQCATHPSGSVQLTPRIRHAAPQPPLPSWHHVADTTNSRRTFIRTHTPCHPGHRVPYPNTPLPPSACHSSPCNALGEMRLSCCFGASWCTSLWCTLCGRLGSPLGPLVGHV